jgi:hypothetical protein
LQSRSVQIYADGRDGWCRSFGAAGLEGRGDRVDAEMEKIGLSRLCLPLFSSLSTFRRTVASTPMTPIARTRNIDARPVGLRWPAPTAKAAPFTASQKGGGVDAAFAPSPIVGKSKTWEHAARRDPAANQGGSRRPRPDAATIAATCSRSTSSRLSLAVTGSLRQQPPSEEHGLSATCKAWT